MVVGRASGPRGSRGPCAPRCLQSVRDADWKSEQFPRGLVAAHATSLVVAGRSSIFPVVADLQRWALERQRDREIANAPSYEGRAFENWLDEKIVVAGDKEAAAALDRYERRQAFEAIRDLIPDVTEEQVAARFTPEGVAATDAIVDENRITAGTAIVPAKPGPVVLEETHRGLPVVRPMWRKINDGRGTERPLERKVVDSLTGGRF